MPLNYTQTIADIRAEIERLEAEYGPVRAFPATTELLQAMECLRAAKTAIFGRRVA